MTILAGQRLKASDMRLALAPPECQARCTTAQSIPNNTATAVLLDTEDFDTDGIHSTSSNTSRMTIVTDGWYSVSAMIPYSGNATGARDLRLIKNTSTLVPGGRISVPVSAAANSSTPTLPNLLVQLVATDFLEIQAFQTSGGALALNNTNGLFAYLHVRWVSA